MAKEISKTEFLKTVKGAYAKYLKELFIEKSKNCVKKLIDEKFQSMPINELWYHMHFDSISDMKTTFTQKGFGGAIWRSIGDICMGVDYHTNKELVDSLQYPDNNEPIIERVVMQDGCVEVTFKIEYHKDVFFLGKARQHYAIVCFNIKADYKKTIEETKDFKPKVCVLKDAFGNEIHERDEVVYTKTNYVWIFHDIVEKIIENVVYLSSGPRLYLDEKHKNGNIAVLNSKLGWMNIL